MNLGTEKNIVQNNITIKKKRNYDSASLKRSYLNYFLQPPFTWEHAALHDVSQASFCTRVSEHGHSPWQHRLVSATSSSKISFTSILI